MVHPEKGLYFMKNDEVLVPKENSGSVMKVGDLSQIPLDHLSSLVDDLNILLEHGENFTSWPNVVSADVTTQAGFQIEGLSLANLSRERHLAIIYLKTVQRFTQ